MNQIVVRKITLLVFIAVVLIAVAVLGYMYYEPEKENNIVTLKTTNNVNSANTNNTIRNANATINTNTDETDNWLIYENDKLGIQFEYPRLPGNISVAEFDYTQNTNQNVDNYARGKAIELSVPFENSVIYIFGSSSDFQHMYKESYNGNLNLSSECDNPGKIGDSSYCINKQVAGQNTFDGIFFQSPECSPMFVRQSKLNSNNIDYPGIIISQFLHTDGEWDCGSTPEEFDAVTKSELKKLVEKTYLTADGSNKMDDFNLLLQSFKFTEPQ